MEQRMDLVKLQEQLAATEAELEEAKSHVYRCDGALQMIKHLINELESGVQAPPETFGDSLVDNAPTQ